MLGLLNLKTMLIRKIEKSDLQLRVDWMNNPKIYSSMHFDLPVLLENTVRWFENNQTNNHRSDVCFVEKDEIVAFGGLTSIDDVLKKAELYIFVNPDSHKSGIGTRATKLLCKYGFEELDLHKIYLLTNENNVAAIKVYQKCGFILEGRLRDEYMAEGGYMDRLYFGLLKTEFDE